MGGPLQRPAKLAVATAHRIVADIDREGLRPGDRLPTEVDLQERYDVSRATLREALRLLEVHGVLSTRAGRTGGAVVRTPAAAELGAVLALTLQFADAPYSSVVETRQAIDPLLARFAAERATDDELDRLRDLLAELAGQEHGDPVGFLRANRAFGTALAEATHNPPLQLFAQALSEIISTRFTSEARNLRGRERVVRARRRVLEAVRARDPRAAEAAAADYVAAYDAVVAGPAPGLLATRVSWPMPR
ncbi:FadR/GntR family transcriptional regulator [Geodermatophilus normandii]|uniref:FadR family transcriptional regulator n=1 Tax=Geodermatophilus normandii TaxID=1137989 RepID=A0A6P0GEL8_9ACTN|nr:FCD domain-containing protein [Geodermatophilus normandii]NEM05694.1 FadR family transcriptional regulator [Geodermatophilus normandii]